ncbi:MAG: MaoC family dehydratase N-terminal domain-containing protein [Deltaproteobacteria bacterium]|nr:MAG: MaoC family dehydratase N-terminal domain-containing protein [Deltaproteobacteria bacterium]
MAKEYVEFGKITDEALGRLKSKVGTERDKVPKAFRSLPWAKYFIGFGLQDRVLTEELVVRFAIGIADMNPLYYDKEYAEKSRWKGQICPPGMLSLTEKCNGAMEGLPGCHTIWREAEYEWYRPMMVGDVLDSKTYLVKVEKIPSKFAGGKAVTQKYETHVKNQQGEDVGKYISEWHRFERSGAKKASKYEEFKLAEYSKEDMDKIYEDYQKEVKRGAETRYWEDVEVGEETPFLIKGPTTQTSKFAYESVMAPGGWLVGHHLWNMQVQMQPKLPFYNEQGIPEPPVAIHWSNERSQKILGLPGAYESGYERTNWQIQMLMNWMGDDGLLRRLTQRYPKFNLMGDTTWCHAKVIDKFEDGDQHVVKCEVWTINQRKDITTTGEAEIVLPAKK